MKCNKNNFRPDCFKLFKDTRRIIFNFYRMVPQRQQRLKNSRSCFPGYIRLTRYAPH